jgi:hypothetical protein
MYTTRGYLKIRLVGLILSPETKKRLGFCRKVPEELEVDLHEGIMVNLFA